MEGEKIVMDELSSPSTSQRPYDGHSDSLSERLDSDYAHNSSTGLLAVPGPNTRDPESQQEAPPEHFVPLRSKLLFLAAYFFLNLFLTLSNKAVLGKARFPWLLTGKNQEPPRSSARSR